MQQRRYKNLLSIISFFFLVLFFIYIWLARDALSKNDVEERYPTFIQTSLPRKVDSEQLLILVWTWPFGEVFPLDTCQSVHGISGCSLTANRNLSSQADAVIIHHYDIMYNKFLPKGPRPHYQRWIWFNIEPPLILENLSILDNLINLTMTYKENSDIFIPYGFMKPLKEPQTFTVPTKSKLVAWVVSRWYPGVQRTAYYEELKKHIHIDVYGKHHRNLTWDKFYDTLSQYKFYLAFENSAHTDYITEKLWRNSFGLKVVPVVLGAPRENYERFIPPDSFIHVNDFSSPKELAQFLLELDKNNERYEQFFKWRSKYVEVTETGWDNYYCKACRKLHEYRGYKVIPSVEKWFLK